MQLQRYDRRNRVQKPEHKWHGRREVIADLKAKVARREHYELHPEVDVIVATEQEFFNSVLPHMFEPMTDEQRFFNEQGAIIERNKQSALAALLQGRGN